MDVQLGSTTGRERSKSGNKARSTVESNLRRLYADVLVQLRMREGQLNCLLDLLDLLFQAAHVGIRLRWRLLHLPAVRAGTKILNLNFIKI